MRNHPPFLPTKNTLFAMFFLSGFFLQDPPTNTREFPISGTVSLSRYFFYGIQYLDINFYKLCHHDINFHKLFYHGINFHELFYPKLNFYESLICYHLLLIIIIPSMISTFIIIAPRNIK